MKFFTQQKILLVTTFLLLEIPRITYAAQPGIKDLIISVHYGINLLIGIVAGCALLFFFWGLANFIRHMGNDEGAVEEGRAFMKWGIVGLFVMVSIWGIVNFLIDATGIDPTRIGPVRTQFESVNDSLVGPSGQSVNPLAPH